MKAWLSAAPILLSTLFALACAPGMAQVPGAPRTLAELTRGLHAQPGFIDVWRDNDKGRVLLSVAALDTPFLLVSSLPYGLGSNDVGLDRGQAGDVRMAHFEKRGARLFLVQDNVGFIANSASREERNAVTESFAASVLWAGEILSAEGGRQLVDFSSFLLTDQHGIAARLGQSKQGAYKIDDKRSAVLTEQSLSFPDNVELEALLTFQGPGEAAYVRQVGPDPASLSLRQHISMVRLPDAGYRPRAYHPGSGGFDTSYVDFATPLAANINVRWQVRHRLEKTDPGAAVSTVKKPIVFYLDRGAPEPVRSALLDGARWWTGAFEKAGFKDAYRVEMLPEGVDPMDVRYNVIHWVHRATRGWSYGNAQADPRTGEIIRGTVSLGSQRVRQDILIAEALLAPYAKGAGPERAAMAEQMALARLRQLAAHEVGHTLGFAHNFATSRQGNASVMDYPHPILTVNGSGALDLSSAYGVGIGVWDEFVVQHVYGEFGAADEAAALVSLRAGAKAAGLQYVGDSDARSPGSGHPDGLLWDYGPDSIKTWDQLLAVRKRALENFSIDVLPDGRQTGELEARLVPVYLLHRYQAEAIARLLGGGEFEYGTSGDVRAGAVRSGVRTTPAPVQRQAMQRLVDSLRSEHLALPASLLDVLTPPAQGFERGREYFATGMNSVFDAFSAVEAGAGHASAFLLDPQRLNRLAWQHARDRQQPGVQELLALLLQRTWKRDAVPTSVVAGEAVQLAANWVVLDGLLNVLAGAQLHAAVDAEVRQELAQFVQWLHANRGSAATAASRKEASGLIARYLADPRSVTLRPAPAVPPGAPI